MQEMYDNVRQCTTMYDILPCGRWKSSCIELLYYPQKTISGFLYASQDGYWHLCSETAAVKSDQKSIGKGTWLTWTFSNLHRIVWTKNMYPRITSNMAHLKRRTHWDNAGWGILEEIPRGNAMAWLCFSDGFCKIGMASETFSLATGFGILRHVEMLRTPRNQ